MIADRLLSRLERVRQVGRGRWVACCPAHRDRHPSLSITEAEDGRLLLRDFGQQCAASAIVQAVGLELHDLFPERRDEHFRPAVRRPFTGDQLLQVIDRESIVAVIVTCDVVLGGGAEQADLDRLRVARERLAEVLNHV